MKSLTEEQIKQLAHEILAFLNARSIFDTAIYYNGRCIMSECDYDNYASKRTEEILEYHWLEKIDCVETERKIEEYVPGADEDTVIGLRYEGEFYAMMNYGRHPEWLEEFNEILAKNGVYKEIYDHVTMLIRCWK